MSFTKLPSEILYPIALILINESESIASLGAVNKITYQALHALVYRSVNLRSTKSVTSLFGVITSLRPKYSVYITNLQIGPDWMVNYERFKLNSNLVPHLRRVLQNLENLVSLSLSITPKALNTSLNDLAVPFRLNTFVHSGKLSIPLLHFLEGQSTITKLGWHGTMNTSELDSLYCLVEGTPSLLPKLEVLEGPLYLLKALIPIRQISSITILQWLDYRWSVEEFLNSMKRTAAPITRIDFVDIVPIGTGWIGIGWIEVVKGLQSTPAFLTLKEIHVVKLFEVDMDDREPMVGHIFPGNVPFDFLRFEALEEFEFSHNTDARHAPSPTKVQDWLTLHQMHQLTTWRELSPSLNTVSLWGSVIS